MEAIGAHSIDKMSQFRNQELANLVWGEAAWFLTETFNDLRVDIMIMIKCSVATSDPSQVMLLWWPWIVPWWLRQLPKYHVFKAHFLRRVRLDVGYTFWLSHWPFCTWWQMFKFLIWLLKNALHPFPNTLVKKELSKCGTCCDLSLDMTSFHRS